MSKPSRHRILVSQDQYDWIAKTVTRKADQAKQIEVNKRLREEVALFADKLAGSPDYQLDGSILLPTNRGELRILEALADNERKALLEQVVPGYEARSLVDYANQARANAGKLEALLTIVRKGLAQ